MDSYETTKETAKRWKTREAIVQNRCPEIPGAVCRGGRWFLPVGTAKPEDVPVLSAAECALPLGIGGENFKIFSNSAYYVDKTLLLQEIIDAGPGVYWFTRPRRFGKSLNLDMIRTFFERTEEDNAVYFADKKIWFLDRKYREQQGKYPAICLNFQTARKSTWQQTRGQICKLLRDEVERHEELAESAVCGKAYRKMVKRFDARGDNRYDFENTLLDLSRMLADHYGEPAVVLIDEVDVPIRHGYAHGFDREVTEFLRNLFVGGCKGNKAVQYCVLMGILQIAANSVFGDLNHLRASSVLDARFGPYFGFTADEVREMTAEYRAEDKLDEIQCWYRGYTFGGTEIYNPWSIANYFGSHCSAEDYWVSTSGNAEIGALMDRANGKTLALWKMLLQGQTVRVIVDLRMEELEIREDPAGIFGFLLAAGYLTAIDSPPAKNGDCCTLAIPNREIRRSLQAEMRRRFPADAAG